MFVTVDQNAPDAYFQLRTRWRNPETGRWQTVDLEGPFTLQNAILGAQAITGACPEQRLYAAIEDLREPVTLEHSNQEPDMCRMVARLFSATEFQFLNEGVTT